MKKQKNVIKEVKKRENVDKKEEFRGYLNYKPSAH